MAREEYGVEGMVSGKVDKERLEVDGGEIGGQESGLGGNKGKLWSEGGTKIWDEKARDGEFTRVVSG